MVSFFTDDCVFEDMAFGVVMHGKDEVQEFVATTLAAYPDFAMVRKSSLGAGPWLATEWVMTGTYTGSMTGVPATGRSFSVRGASVTEFDRDKIKRHTDYWSLSLLLEQLRLPGGNL